jgi:UDP-N-acetylmuramyl pentapeptide phosphotransferase/UDP-N-acetylglucosamine-1-phosphate transferase
MIDGIDGLAGATIALPLLVLYVLALQAEHPGADFLLALLVSLDGDGSTTYIAPERLS